jgi:hypothetical protein
MPAAKFTGYRRVVAAVFFDDYRGTHFDYLIERGHPWPWWLLANCVGWAAGLAVRRAINTTPKLVNVRLRIGNGSKNHIVIAVICTQIAICWRITGA